MVTFYHHLPYAYVLLSLSTHSYRHFFFFFSSRRRHTRLQGDWSSDVCSSDLGSLTTPAFRNSYVALRGSLGTVALGRLDSANPTGSPLYSQVTGITSFAANDRSEERRVGKECRSRWSPYH